MPLGSLGRVLLGVWFRIWGFGDFGFKVLEFRVLGFFGSEFTKAYATDQHTHNTAFPNSQLAQTPPNETNVPIPATASDCCPHWW